MLKVAIVGRPNVGKSSLFNRLAGKKLALVDDRPGVTRDRREGQGRIGDIDLLLIDTAGFEDVRDQSLEARMRAQTERAIADADVVLFVIDARDGVTGLDEQFGALLRRADKPVLLLANKAEGKASEDGVLQAYSLGLGQPVPISAEHGEGMSDLYEAIRQVQETRPGAEDAAGAGRDALKLAIIGRPNAGKSTLVNAMLGEERVITGPEAGITRDSIAIDWTWRDKQIRLTDTAGMRRKARVEEKLEKLSVAETLRAIQFAEVCVLVMDAREAFEKQDLQIADLVAREGRAIVYALAKWDLVEEPQKRFEELKNKADRLLPQTRGAPLVRLSALAGRGVDALMEAVFGVYDDWNTRVKTGELNRWLREAMERNPPPVVDGRRVKPRYITQVKARPPTFVLVCSRASYLPETYQRFLLNGIRDAFGLPAVPMRIFVRQNSKNPFADDKD
jgi:GTP-binding protein